MVGPDAHGDPTFFAQADQRGEALTDSVELLSVLRVRVFADGISCRAGIEDVFMDRMQSLAEA